jgi:hypothetical protein
MIDYESPQTGRPVGGRDQSVTISLEQYAKKLGIHPTVAAELMRTVGENGPLEAGENEPRLLELSSQYKQVIKRLRGDIKDGLVDKIKRLSPDSF